MNKLTCGFVCVIILISLNICTSAAQFPQTIAGNFAGGTRAVASAGGVTAVAQVPQVGLGFHVNAGSLLPQWQHPQQLPGGIPNPLSIISGVSQQFSNQLGNILSTFNPNQQRNPNFHQMQPHFDQHGAIGNSLHNQPQHGQQNNNHNRPNHSQSQFNQQNHHYNNDYNPNNNGFVGVQHGNHLQQNSNHNNNNHNMRPGQQQHQNNNIHIRPNQQQLHANNPNHNFNRPNQPQQHHRPNENQSQQIHPPQNNHNSGINNNRPVQHQQQHQDSTPHHSQQSQQQNPNNNRPMHPPSYLPAYESSTIPTAPTPKPVAPDVDISDLISDIFKTTPSPTHPPTYESSTIPTVPTPKPVAPDVDISDLISDIFKTPSNTPQPTPVPGLTHEPLMKLGSDVVYPDSPRFVRRQNDYEYPSTGIDPRR